MIKLYTTTVIGVDTEDDRTMFTLNAFDATCAKLTIETRVSPRDIDLLCDAIQQAMERMELATE